MKPMLRNRASVLLLACVVTLSGCATVRSYWPFGHKAVAAQAAVREVEVKYPEDQATPVILQFWERNTLVIDLQNVPSTGQAELTRAEGKAWPVRLAFRMSPTRFETLEVRGAQRVVLPVSAGAGAVTVELPPGTVDAATGSVQLRWGVKNQF
jgi:uncharacterized protein YceK